MNKRGKTLIILTPGFPESEDDSTCLPAQQQFILSLKKTFPLLDIIVLSFHYPYTGTGYEWHQLKIIPFNGRNKRGILKPLLWGRVWIALLRINRSDNIIGIFSFWCGECALIGRYFGGLNSIRHLIWISGQDARKENKLVKLIRPQPGSLIAMSDFLADMFYRSHLIKPAHIVYNGIDPDLYGSGIASERGIDIIGIGSLIPLKQFEMLVAIVQDIRKELPGVKALICGSGPEQARLQALIEVSGLQQNVQLSGEKPHDEILTLLKRSKMLLHPSNYEGFPGVCLEALFAGAHVISFCKPVYKPIAHWHIVQDKQGMLRKSLDILKQPDTEFTPVLVNDIKSSAVAVMNLFSYSDAAIS